jgi:hypothetical protein
VAVFNVTITTNTTPAVALTMTGNTTYQQFKNSLGQFVYNVKTAYIYSINQTQVQGIFNYTLYDVNGNKKTETIVSQFDPYQYIPSLFIDTKNRSIILNGSDYIRFNLLPNTNLTVKIFAERLDNQKGLDKYSPNNFKKYENVSGNINFFEQYKDFI